MTRIKRWKLPEAERGIAEIMSAARSHFALPYVPQVDRTGPGSDWELRSAEAIVWTVAGPASFTVSVTDTFAHLYFRFHVPAQAVEKGVGSMGRLNEHSGKWNRHDSPPTPLQTFVDRVVEDFGRVAEKDGDKRALKALQTREEKSFEITKRHNLIRAITDPDEKRRALLELFQDGISTYETALDLDPADYVGFWELGLQQMARGEIESNLEALRREITSLE